MHILWQTQSEWIRLNILHEVLLLQPSVVLMRTKDYKERFFCHFGASSSITEYNILRCVQIAKNIFV